VYVRQFMLKLYDREDGKAADWPLIAETQLHEAFMPLIRRQRTRAVRCCCGGFRLL
jgi:hypothetical protein